MRGWCLRDFSLLFRRLGNHAGQKKKNMSVRLFSYCLIRLYMCGVTSFHFRTPTLTAATSSSNNNSRNMSSWQPALLSSHQRWRRTWCRATPWSSRPCTSLTWPFWRSLKRKFSLAFNRLDLWTCFSCFDLFIIYIAVSLNILKTSCCI